MCRLTPAQVGVLRLLIQLLLEEVGESAACPCYPRRRPDVLLADKSQMKEGCGRVCSGFTGSASAQ